MPLDINHGPRRPVSEDLRPIDADKFLQALSYEKILHLRFGRKRSRPSRDLTEQALRTFKKTLFAKGIRNRLMYAKELTTNCVLHETHGRI